MKLAFFCGPGLLEAGAFRGGLVSQALNLAVALLLEVFKAEPAELVVFCRRARHFIIEPLLPIAPRRRRLLDRAIPALMQILGSAFGILPNAFQFLAKMRLGRLGAQIEQSHGPPDRDGQRPGRRPGSKPSEKVQDTRAPEAGDEGNACVLPGETGEGETGEE